MLRPNGKDQGIGEAMKKHLAAVYQDGLLITDLPKFDLANVQAAIRDAIHWQTHYPTTREERIARDEALIRLRQADWHVSNALLMSAG